MAKAKELIQILPHSEPTPSPKAKEATPVQYKGLQPDNDFVFMKPFGEILMSRVWMAGKKYVQEKTPGAEHMCIIKPWWCHPDYIQQYRDLCTDWLANGFTFHVGSHTLGGEPDVIPGPEFERGPSKPFCASTRGYIAKIGWKKIWLEISDAHKALTFVQYRKDIPLPVLMDCLEYAQNPEYVQVYDACREQFWYYFEHMRPMK